VDQDDSRIEVYEGKELYVSDGYIAEEFRRQGIYHKLNKQLEQTYIDKGVLRITRFTHIQNTRMRQLLEEEGYFVTRLLYEKWVD
jgi:ribosomal protein S18 acetylase RimI-like enzyme